MPIALWKSWHAPAAAGWVLLTVAACAPNTVRTPGVDASMSADREESRYGVLLRLAASTRAAGDPAAAVNLYQQAIALDSGRPDAYVLLGDTLNDVKS